MTASRSARPRRAPLFRSAGSEIPAGETRDLVLDVSETYTGRGVGVPIRVIRARQPGPALFLTGAIHGDELNGTGIIREVMRRGPKLRRGTLVCVPVVNVYGFENHSRYLPDRRDLNRCFPGKAAGSLADRLAYRIFHDVVAHCDFGIELHTAPVRRTNFPNVRADLDRPEVARLARAFGCGIVLHQKGHEASLRRVACEHGCPTILLEAGESLKFETDMIAVGVRGVENVLRELGMLPGRPTRPRRELVARRGVWVRSSSGGILRLVIAPGDRVREGQEIARCEDLFGNEQERILSPAAGVAVGMTTLPAVKPGEPVCHVVVEEEGRSLRKSSRGG